MILDNGFVQVVGPQGTGLHAPIVTFLNPDEPFLTGAEVLASSQTGWGLPQPTLIDYSLKTGAAGVADLLVPANAERTYLLIYCPQAGGAVAVAQGQPVVGTVGTVLVGTGQAILQNTPGSVWTGEVYIMSQLPNVAYFAWEGST